MMAEPSSFDPMFPKLDEVQIARLAPLGRHRHAAAGEVLWERGAAKRHFYVLLSGRVEIVSPGRDDDTRVTVQEAGEFTGELDIVSGRHSLVRARALVDSELLEIDVASIRRLVQVDPELGELFLHAFVLRRAHLIANNLGGLVLIGSNHSADTLRLKAFLVRNEQPYTYLDVDRDPDVAQILEHFRIDPDEIPVVMCRDRDAAFRNPSNADIARALGFNSESDGAKVHDLVVVGAGPAGLAAAVYAASEGLDVLVLETSAPGGQAGSSSKIENYLGFPLGISGQRLAEDALLQAQKFNAQIAIARPARRLDCSSRQIRVDCSDGTSVRAKSVIVATGAAYRKLNVPALARFEGAGVYYGATHMEAQLCRGEEVVVVGGGNSAGQAAMFLSEKARHVHMLVRAPGLAASMSAYLITRIDKSPTITLRTSTWVEGLDGNGRLERIAWCDSKTGAREVRDIHHLFSMIGADANTGWLAGCLALDPQRFVKTGTDLTADELHAAAWPLRRRPYTYETSVPKVFAVGDVRAGSMKRVAAAVGEGSAAVQAVHKVLAEE
jgi:thioredoxin reductase (NADPH)